MGDAVLVDPLQPPPADPAARPGIEPVRPAFGPPAYLSPDSDMAALMVFDHQMHMTNLLFVDEAPLPAPITGTSGFAEQFGRTGPRDGKGRSLRQLDLRTRLLRHPCSYMIYAEAFDGLPAAARDAIYARMWQILSGADRGKQYARLSLADRQAIVEILRDTRTGLPDDFQQTVR